MAGLLSGCSTISQTATAITPIPESYAAMTGNWRFTATAGVPIELAGALAVQGTQVSGRLHVVSGPCTSTTGMGDFAVSGAIDDTRRLQLSGQKDATHAFQIAGALAPDHRSLVEPVVTASGPCAADRVLQARDNSASTGQQYQPVTGNYDGTFTDADGDGLAVAASLSQPTTPDANGVYHLTGTATFAGVPCLGSPVVTSSTVTGNQISATYTDSTSGATVVGSGTFSADAQMLTISSWTLSGSCGSDSGSGLMTHQ